MTSGSSWKYVSICLSSIICALFWFANFLPPWAFVAAGGWKHYLSLENLFDFSTQQHNSFPLSHLQTETNSRSKGSCFIDILVFIGELSLVLYLAVRYNKLLLVSVNKDSLFSHLHYVIFTDTVSISRGHTPFFWDPLNSFCSAFLPCHLINTHKHNGKNSGRCSVSVRSNEDFWLWMVQITLLIQSLCFLSAHTIWL